jgi:hypothetical protein
LTLAEKVENFIISYPSESARDVKKIGHTCERDRMRKEAILEGMDRSVHRAFFEVGTKIVLGFCKRAQKQTKEKKICRKPPPSLSKQHLNSQILNNTFY